MERDSSTDRHPGNHDSSHRAAEAFAREAYRFKPQLLRLAAWLLHDEDAAEDAVEDAILQGLAKQEQLADPSRLGGWLARIVYNRCLNQKRRFRSDTPLDSVAPFLQDLRSGRNPAERTLLVEQMEKVLDGMLFLEPPEYSEVLVLYYYQKRTYEEISAELEIPVGTVKSRLNRGRELLQQQLVQDGISLQDLEQIKDLARWPDIRLG